MNNRSNYVKRAGFMPRLWIVDLVVLFVMFTLSKITFAQVNTLKKGDRIKLSAPSVSKKPLVGTFMTRSNTLTVLYRSKDDSTYYIINTLIDRIYISSGKKRNTGRGALIGAVSGGLILGITASVTNSEIETKIDPDISGGFEYVVVGAAIGILGGGAVGAIIGAINQTEQWERMPVQISMGITPTHKKEYAFSPMLSLRLPIGNR